MWGGFQYHRPRNVVLLASSTDQVSNPGPSGDIVNYTNATDTLSRGEILEFQIVCTGLIAGTYSMTIYFNDVAFFTFSFIFNGGSVLAYNGTIQRYATSDDWRYFVGVNNTANNTWRAATGVSAVDTIPGINLTLEVTAAAGSVGAVSYSILKYSP